MKIINLDALMCEDREITLGGKKWIIPGELSVEYILRLIYLQEKLADVGDEDPEIWDKILEMFHEIFSIRNNKITPVELKKMLTIRQFGVLLGTLLSGDNDTSNTLTDEEKKTILPEVIQTKNQSTIEKKKK